MAIGSKAWGESTPWDDIHRDKYTEKEVAMDERWEKLILAKRKMENVQEAATKGCRKSKIELGHLERGKGPTLSVVKLGDESTAGP
jgi:hypothetical protein